MHLAAAVPTLLQMSILSVDTVHVSVAFSIQNRPLFFFGNDTKDPHQRHFENPFIDVPFARSCMQTCQLTAAIRTTIDVSWRRPCTPTHLARDKWIIPIFEEIATKFLSGPLLLHISVGTGSKQMFAAVSVYLDKCTTQTSMCRYIVEH